MAYKPKTKKQFLKDTRKQNYSDYFMLHEVLMSILLWDSRHKPHWKIPKEFRILAVASLHQDWEENPKVTL